MQYIIICAKKQKIKLEIVQETVFTFVACNEEWYESEKNSQNYKHYHHSNYTFNGENPVCASLNKIST